jgi:hypothetical protein
MNIQRAALREQAKSDFRIYLMLSDQPLVEPCHKMHYLMMACEKLMKSCDDSFKEVHEIADMFMLSRFHLLGKNYRGKRQALRNGRAVLHRVATQFDAWVPKGNQPSRKNPEYPYLKDGDYVAPCTQSFHEIDARDLTIMVSFMQQML